MIVNSSYDHIKYYRYSLKSIIDIYYNRLYYYILLVSSKTFQQYSSISEQDIDLIQRQYEELLEYIRPNAVGLVDAFDIRDEVRGTNFYLILLLSLHLRFTFFSFILSFYGKYFIKPFISLL